MTSLLLTVTSLLPALMFAAVVATAAPSDLQTLTTETPDSQSRANESVMTSRDEGACPQLVNQLSAAVAHAQTDVARLRHEKHLLDQDVSTLRKMRRDDLDEEIIKSNLNRKRMYQEINLLINRSLDFQTENLQLKFKYNELNQLNKILNIEYSELLNKSEKARIDIKELRNGKNDLLEQINEIKLQKEEVDSNLQSTRDHFANYRAACDASERGVTIQDNATRLPLTLKLDLSVPTPQSQGNHNQTQQLPKCSKISAVLGLVNLNGHHYFVSDIGEKKTWHDALVFCRKFDLDLVNIQTKEENDALFKHLEKRFSSKWGNVWVGATDLFAEGHWVYTSTGRPLNFTLWHSGQPDGGEAQNCVVMNRPVGGKWYDNPCKTLDPFICEVREPCELECNGENL